MGLAVSGWQRQKRWTGRQERQAFSVTLWKYIAISVCLFCFYISLKMLLYGTNPSSTVCFSFSAHIIKESMFKKSKAVLNNQNSSIRLSNVNFLFLARLLLFFSTGSEALISIRLSSVYSFNVLSISS